MKKCILCFKNKIKPNKIPDEELIKEISNKINLLESHISELNQFNEEKSNESFKIILDKIKKNNRINLLIGKPTNFTSNKLKVVKVYQGSLFSSYVVNENMKHDKTSSIDLNMDFRKEKNIYLRTDKPHKYSSSISTFEATNETKFSKQKEYLSPKKNKKNVKEIISDKNTFSFNTYTYKLPILTNKHNSEMLNNNVNKKKRILKQNVKVVNN